MLKPNLLGPPDAFLKNVSQLATGHTFAALIPIVAAPALGRLYTPMDYGILGSFLSLSMIFGTIANWQYSEAIVLEANEDDALGLVHVCSANSLLTSIGSLVIVTIALASLWFAGHLSPLTHSLWALPFATYLAGTTTAYTAVANRLERFSLMSFNRVVSVAIGTLLCIGLGLLETGAQGLVIGFLAVHVASYLLFCRSLRGLVRKKVNAEARARLLRTHRDFAYYSLPGSFISKIGINLPIYALTFLGATHLIGLFNRAQQLLSIPILMLGQALGQVFKQRASIHFITHGRCDAVYLKTLIALCLIGSLPAAVLWAFAPDLFEIILGERWREAGDLARILTPLLLLRLVCSPLSTLFHIAGAQREDFALSAVFVLVAAIVSAGLITFAADAIWIVYSYSAIFSLMYVLYIVRGYVLSRNTAARGEPCPARA